MSVVQFPSVCAAEKIWVCGCGCSTFKISGRLEVICASCGGATESGVELGSWYEVAKDAPLRGPDDLPRADIEGNGSEEFWRARIANIASDDDVALAVIVKKNDSLHVFGLISTAPQLKWGNRKLREAMKIMRTWIK